METGSDLRPHPGRAGLGHGRGRGRLADDLIAEGLRVLEEAPQRKDEFGRGDLLSEQAQPEAGPAGPS